MQLEAKKSLANFFVDFSVSFLPLEKSAADTIESLSFSGEENKNKFEILKWLSRKERPKRPSSPEHENS